MKRSTELAHIRNILTSNGIKLNIGRIYRNKRANHIQIKFYHVYATSTTAINAAINALTNDSKIAEVYTVTQIRMPSIVINFKAN
jgi:GH25 family lysozyme M1 (1,4-beta-N-acetylmuramidase)